ncbi:hypothetical protein [Rhodospirillum sp. A1_3_36]|uniref:hypothetical protein n=1 Tax=Rhodospirillum sp. A1_3_36 TaxID=3391666 RepID=UPI0039A6DA3A
MTAPLPSYREQYGNLPDVCVRLLEGGGEELMLRVVAKLKGTHVPIPVTLSVHHKLVQILGDKDAAAVHRIFRGPDGPAAAKGDFRIFVPSMFLAMQKVRRARILSLLNGGAKVWQVALRLSVSEKTIYNEIRRAKSRGETVASPQMDLFG